MKKPLRLFVIALVILAGYALVAAQKAFHRGELPLFFVLLAIAVILWTRAQRKS